MSLALAELKVSTMTEMTLIQTDFATLVYHPDAKIVHHTFHKPIGGQEFRNVLNTGAEAMEKYGATKWLSDDRNNSVLSPEDGGWGSNDWFPRAVKAGFKYWALVVPDDILARMDLKQYIDSFFEQGLRVMVFTKPEDAMAWLRKVDANK